MKKLALSSIALALLGSCTKTSGTCTMGSDCASNSCYPSPRSPSMFCLVTDASCTSGLRWAPNAGDGLAGMCVGGTLPPADDMTSSQTQQDLTTSSTNDDIGFHFPDMAGGG